MTGPLPLPLARAFPPKIQTGRLATVLLRGLDRLALTLAWLAANLLMALGLCVLVVALVGHLSFAGFFLEIGNLAAHYASANPSQRGRFDAGLVLAIAAMTAVIALARWRSFVGANLRPAHPSGEQLPGEHLP